MQSGSSSWSRQSGSSKLKQTQSGNSCWSGHSWGVAAEVDTIEEQQAEADTVGEQQLKRTQLGSSSWSTHNQGAASWTAAEADAVREQQLKWSQSGCSLVWPRETSACQRHYHIRLLECQSRSCAGLTQTWWRKWDLRRPQKHTYAMCCAALTPLHHDELHVLDYSRRRTKGCLESVDWTTGMA